jgi:uncharacterized protein YggE
MNPTRLSLAALIGAALLLALATTVAWPDSATSAADEAENGITVTASGSVEAVPDRAGLTFGVTTNGGTSEAALAANSSRMRSVVAALKSAGIPEAKVQTDSVSVSPRISPIGERTEGFTAENSLSVEVAADRAGEIVDLAVGNGATNVYGPSFDRSDREARYNEALANAVEQARTKAEALAAAANVALGDVTRVVEGGEAGPVVYEAAARAKATPDTPVEPGAEEIRASVTVTFSVD